jgi:hypothetical protein
MLDGGWTSCGCASSPASQRAHPAERLRPPLRAHRCRARRPASFRRPGLRPTPCAGCAWPPASLRRAQRRSRSSRVLIRVCRYWSRSCSHAPAPATPLRCREAVVRQQRPRRRDGSRLVVEPPRRGVACASPTDPCERVRRRRQAGRGALLLLVRRVVAQRCGTSCNWWQYRTPHRAEQERHVPRPPRSLCRRTCVAGPVFPRQGPGGRLTNPLNGTFVPFASRPSS